MKLSRKNRVKKTKIKNKEKERKLRTRRLIQEGAMLEKVFPFSTDESQKLTAKKEQSNLLRYITNNNNKLKITIINIKKSSVHNGFHRRETNKKTSSATPENRVQALPAGTSVHNGFDKTDEKPTETHIFDTQTVFCLWFLQRILNLKEKYHERNH